MPHSLRAKIKGLRYKGIITDKDCERLCKALDNEDVLDKIRTEIKHEFHIRQSEYTELCHAVMGVIDRGENILPSVTPSRRKGHYIDRGLMWECSECGANTRIMKKYNIPNYCPCCGADMRGKEEFLGGELYEGEFENR